MGSVGPENSTLEQVEPAKKKSVYGVGFYVPTVFWLGN